VFVKEDIGLARLRTRRALPENFFDRTIRELVCHSRGPQKFFSSNMPARKVRGEEGHQPLIQSGG
jgi:hypothetical protein